MEQVSLRAEPRNEFGSRASRRMRREGGVPAVLYGRGLDPQNLTVNRRELYSVLHTEAGANALINLEVDGTKKPFLTVAREIQRHPVRGEVAHLDFISISLDEKIHAEVVIEFLGTPEGTKEGGVVETIRTSVNIEALPMEIPGHITVDISAMEVGDTLKVADLPAVEGVEVLDDPESALVTVVIPRIVEETESETEPLLGADGEPIEATGGEEGEEGAAGDGGSTEGDSDDGGEG